MMVTFRKKGKIGPVRTVHLPYLTIRTATFGAYGEKAGEGQVSGPYGEKGGEGWRGERRGENLFSRRR